MLTSSWRSWSLMLMVVSAVGLAGCSSGGDTSGASTTAPTSSNSASASAEAQDASPAEVAAGLRKIDQAAKETAQAAGTDKARATSLDGLIEPVWRTIEDTVKKKDQNTYLTMEDNFAVLEKAADDGNAAAAAKGSAAISTAVQAYLAKFSG